jgi:hypothetical protein
MATKVPVVLLLPIVSTLLVSACTTCPPAPDLERYAEADFGTPEGCIDYLRHAFNRRDAYHINLCFSQALRQDLNLTLDVIHTYMDEFHAEVRKLIGDVDAVQVDEVMIDPATPDIARVRLSSGGRSEVAILVLETQSMVLWRDLPRELVTLPYGANAVRIEGGTVVLSAPAPQSTAEAPDLVGRDVYRVIFESGWRILKFENKDFGPEMRQFMRKLEAEGGGRSPPSPPRDT